MLGKAADVVTAAVLLGIGSQFCFAWVTFGESINPGLQTFGASGSRFNHPVMLGVIVGILTDNDVP